MSKSERLFQEAVKNSIVGRNALQRAIVVASGDKGYYKKGTRLAGGKHLLNTYRSALSSIENNDRFKRSFVSPSVSASIHITLDGSGSMCGGTWEDVVRASHVINHMGVALKVKVDAHLALIGQGSAVNPHGSSDYPMTLVPLIEANKPQGARIAQERYSPVDGTCVSGYASSALHLAERSTADHRVAVYMTDGYCHTTQYLPSLAEMARARGVHLVGVVMGSDAKRIASEHPNALVVKDSADFASQIGKHLANVILGKVS